MHDPQSASAWTLAEGKALGGLPWTVAIVPEAEAGGCDLAWREACLKLLEQELGCFGRDFILDDDMRQEALPILRDEMIGEVL